MKYHPDKLPGPRGLNAFQQLNNANAIAYKSFDNNRTPPRSSLRNGIKNGRMDPKALKKAQEAFTKAAAEKAKKEAAEKAAKAAAEKAKKESSEKSSRSIRREDDREEGRRESSTNRC